MSILSDESNAFPFHQASLSNRDATDDVRFCAFCFKKVSTEFGIFFQTRRAYIGGVKKNTVEYVDAYTLFFCNDAHRESYLARVDAAPIHIPVPTTESNNEVL